MTFSFDNLVITSLGLIIIIITLVSYGMPRSKRAVRAPARFADGMEPPPKRTRTRVSGNLVPVPANVTTTTRPTNSINAEEVSVPVASGSGDSAPVTSAQGSATHANGQGGEFSLDVGASSGNVGVRGGLIQGSFSDKLDNQPVECELALPSWLANCCP